MRTVFATELRASSLASPHRSFASLGRFYHGRRSFETGYRGVTNFRRPLSSSAGWILSVLLCGTYGCGADTRKDIEIPPAHNNLRNLATAYTQASIALNH